MKFPTIGINLGMAETICKNCTQQFDGNFCPGCGQSSKVHRVNAAYFLHDVPHSIFHVDRGFPYTFGRLIKNPSGMLMDYLEGKRTRYFRPFGYVIILSAISSVLISQIGVLMDHLRDKKGVTEKSEFLYDFSNYQSVFIFLMIPFVSVCTWLIFRKNRFNFWEHVLMNTYLAAQLNVLLVLIHLFSLAKLLITGSESYSLFIFMTGFMTYYAFTFSGIMYTEIRGWKLGLKLSLMCFILASIYATCMKLTDII